MFYILWQSGVRWALLFSRQIVPSVSLLWWQRITPILHDEHQTVAKPRVSSLPVQSSRVDQAGVRTSHSDQIISALRSEKHWLTAAADQLSELNLSVCTKIQTPEKQWAALIHSTLWTAATAHCEPEYVMRCNTQWWLGIHSLAECYWKPMGAQLALFLYSFRPF